MIDTEQHVREVCKIGKREECCRYLLIGKGGWECAKITPELKALLDEEERIAQMSAKSDNCEGKKL